MTQPERRQAKPTRDAGARATGASQDKEVSGGGTPGGGGSPRTGPSGPEIRPETTRDGEKPWWRRQRPKAARRGPSWEPRRKERMDPTIPPGGGGSIRNH